MPRTSALFLFLLIGLSAFASPVGQKTAAIAAAGFSAQHRLSSSNALLLAYTDRTASGAVNWYVFNSPDSHSYVIIAGDDASYPVLGYSNQTYWGGADIPSNLAKMLENLKNQMRQIVRDGMGATPEISQAWQALQTPLTNLPLATEAVSPLVKTVWNQAPYYNDKCPYDPNEKKRAVTGCVATAMAQIMNFWQYPEQGTGYHSYKHDYFGTLSANFSQSVYNWAAMPNRVTSKNDAVALLMSDLGVSVEMDYSVQSSGAYVLEDDAGPSGHCSEYALKNYFGYSRNLHGERRENYSDAQWNSLMKGEIDAGRPILHAGFGTGGGHAFVCDGYDNSDYFHFNWGWNGSYDGYFISNALNPTGVGTGGGTGGYNSYQQIIVGLEPDEPQNGGETVKISLYSGITGTPLPVIWGQGFKIYASLLNQGTKTFEGDLGAALFDELGNFVDWVDEISSASALKPNYYFNAVEFASSGISKAFPGTYQVGIYYRPKGEDDYLPVSDYNGNTNFPTLKIIHDADMEMHSDFTFSTTEVTKGKPLTVKAKVGNYGNSAFKGNLYVGFYDLEGKAIAEIEELKNASLANGYFTEYTFSTSSVGVEAGSYLVAMLFQPSGSNYGLVGSTFFSNPARVIVKDQPVPADKYESNNSAGAAYRISPSWAANNAAWVSAGSNLHTTDDLDYYRLSLPQGYSYTLKLTAKDEGNSQNFSVDMVLSYSVDDGKTWSDPFDDGVPGSLTVAGPAEVLVLMAPYFPGSLGSYEMRAELGRSPLSAIQPSDMGAFSIYPNPANGFITIKGGQSAITAYRVVSSTGQVVQCPSSLGNGRLDISHLAPGIYLLQAETSAGILQGQFIKQ